MADILIKNMELPKQMETPITITIFKNGSVWMNDVTSGKGKLPNAKAVALPEHGDLIDRGLVQEVLAQLLPLVITNELTDKEIGLVHRTVGAIAEMINEQEVVVEATE